MTKKKKREIAKRHSKDREKMKKKRKLKMVKSHPKPKSQIVHRPGLPHMGAPEGFRSISMSQAIMEYAKPIMNSVEGGEGRLDDAMQISMLLWNYSISFEKGIEDKKIEKKTLKALRKILKLDKEEAHALFKKMIERHSYLFPLEIQPEPGIPFMFIRKEIRHLIKPYDYRKLVLSNEIIPADHNDRDVTSKIEKLDSLINDGAEYEVYESLLFSLKDECEEQFGKWLIAKGLEDDVQDLSSCPHIYFDFIYGYMHDDIVTLKSMSDVYFIEFFEDFLLRKMMAEPNEYIYWPPALKLFYQFLHEKGYLDNPQKIIKKIDKVEPYFIDVLKKQFS